MRENNLSSLAKFSGRTQVFTIIAIAFAHISASWAQSNIYVSVGPGISQFSVSGNNVSVTGCEFSLFATENPVAKVS
jgi:hypothetical protein